ncbi:MAG: hypothetical protein ABJF10_12305 [Chthoniobacter sp.]|uniref:hypothetical protein n=1 Tax=Chthoniobacter sp. TaxID=2510640 RepID=UPI0032AAFDF8
MKRFALLFAAATLGLSLAAIAEDTDPGYGGGRRWYGGREYDLPTIGNTGLQPLYYRPTMRYYGNGYTVSYRYIPVYKQDSIYLGGTGGSSNFRSETFHLSPEEVARFGAGSPRLTVKDARSSAPRTAVTSIVRKKTSKTSIKTVPEIAPSDAPPITPASDSVPVQPKP